MYLVDSSAWILFLRGEVALDEVIGDDDAAVCPPIIQEVLQGADTPRRYATTREVLFAATVLDAPMPLERYEEAARLYLRCRAIGFTIRKPNDCLIAAVAIAHDITLVHRDRDFDGITDVSMLQAVKL